MPGIVGDAIELLTQMAASINKRASLSCGKMIDDFSILAVNSPGSMVAVAGVR
jgi:hypothetical protein